MRKRRTRTVAGIRVQRASKVGQLRSIQIMKAHRLSASTFYLHRKYLLCKIFLSCPQVNLIPTSLNSISLGHLSGVFVQAQRTS